MRILVIKCPHMKRADVYRGIRRAVMPENTSREALEAQRDEALLNKFIEKNRRFILSCAYKTVGHFVTESDDEWSVALIAFHEAVRSYDIEKGDFNAFAALVIRRRLIDLKASAARHGREIVLDTAEIETDEDDPQVGVQLEFHRKEAELAEQNTDSRPDANPVKDEIDAMQGVLAAYGFSFFDLVKSSPKAGKTKRACAEAVNCIMENPEILNKMRATHTLPIAEIKKISEMKKFSKVPQKILERHRKYIIAATEILLGEYPLLAEYLDYIKDARK